MENKEKTTSTVYIVSAASGTGKTSLVKALLQSFPGIKLSISHTTRQPRSNEEHGVDYYFISQEEFDDMVARNEFLEHANVFGESYGTSKMEVERLLQMGIDIILEVDVQGAQQIRQIISETVDIFILPPSREALEQRILSRKQNTSMDIKKRLSMVKDEVKHYLEYDFLIVNDDFEQAVLELKSIVRAQRCRRRIRVKKYKTLLAELMV